MLTFRLKIREAERPISVALSESVGSLKLREFPSGQRVRLIHRGTELSDSTSFGNTQINEGDVVHCVVRTHEDYSSPQAEAESSVGPVTPGTLLKLCAGALLMGIWLLYFSVPELFQKQTLVMLLTLSMGYSLFLFSLSSSQSRNVGSGASPSDRPEVRM
jgi:hypothetical protein